MSRREAPPRRDGLLFLDSGWALLAVTLLAVALRLFRLGYEPLWLDEGFTWRWAQQSQSLLWGASAIWETNPPLFYALLHPLLGLGNSPALLRSVPLVAGVLTVPVVWLVGCELGSRRVGLLAAALVATSAVHVAYSQEARSYTLLTLGAALAVWGLLRFLRAWPAAPGERPARRRLSALGAYVLGSALALYSHNIAVFLPVLANGVALVAWLGPGRRSLPMGALWLLANLVLLALWSPWLPIVVHQARFSPNIDWIQTPSLPDAAQTLLQLYGLGYPPLGHARLLLLAPVPLLALPAILGRGRYPPATIATLLAFAAGGPLLLYLVSVLGKPIWLDRTLLWTTTLGLVLVAAGTLALPGRRWIAAALVALALVRAVDLAVYYGQMPRKEAWDRAAEIVARGFAPGDTIVLVPWYGQTAFDYYANHLGIPADDVGVLMTRPYAEGMPRIEPADRGLRPVTLEELPAIAARSRHLWVVFYRRTGVGPKGRAMGCLDSLGAIVGHDTFTGRVEVFEIRIDAAARQTPPPVCAGAPALGPDD